MDWNRDGKVSFEEDLFTLSLLSKGGGGGSKKSGCYVATCVYGNYDCPEVWVLRRFRDYILDTTWYGRLFIRTYYAISPKLVRWFGDTKIFRGMWSPFLDWLVCHLKKNGMADTPYEDKY